jgi:hypothetical protein
MILARARVETLEQSARDLDATCPDITAINLPMGFGGRAFGEIPLGELTADALAAGIVTESEIRKATKC